ncbi:SLC13 family permease [Galactobacter caseinivorans]|uniref:C4-dicarboxylate ABC transporter n=1 Tax=Galactobacter caseinivorans TaxID=2676123 RepID=A0A496PHL0_9MICC|nr:SLC13 family permease [Galactobacter caseinivorans]RKW69974.1 C4-dicarboxylate ABC transporter [Galactobacter caseinivorans]
MTQQVIALALFVAVFALATLRKVHLGVMMFAAAAGVGIWLAGMKLSEVVEGFPISILVLLVGVTYFFAIAQDNGTVDRIVDAAIRRVGDRAFALPFVFFLITTGISAMGAPLAGLVMVPIGMPLARKYAIDPLLMGISICSGVSAGGFAPTSLFGIVTYGTAHSVDIDLNPLVLFAVAFAFNVLLIIAAYLIFGGRDLWRRTRGSAPARWRGPQLAQRPALTGHPFEREGLAAANARVTSALAASGMTTPGDAAGSAQSAASPDAAAAGRGSRPAPLKMEQVVTLLCMGGLIVSVVVLALVGLDPDIGVLCFAFATVLTLIDPVAGKSAVAKIDWSTVLMVGGIITFVGVLQHMGVVDMLGEAAAHLGSPLIAAFLICLVGALISAFASTTGMLAALVPLALPLVADGNIAGWAVIAALGVCSSVVDLSPFSTVGATVVASVQEEDKPRALGVLTKWGMSMVVIGPVALVGALVVPTML